MGDLINYFVEEISRGKDSTEVRRLSNVYLNISSGALIGGIPCSILTSGML